MSEKEYDTKLKVTKGYFRSGLPYVGIGNRLHILVIFEGLSFENKAPSGFTLRMIAGSYKRFAKDYTVYSVGRKPSLPSGYSTRDMSEDYATTIRDELGGPLDIMGLSTGGTIAQHFAADHPDLVRRLVLAMTGYSLSEKGRQLQMHVGDLARQGKWNAAYSAIMDGVYHKGGIKKRLYKLLMWFFATFSAPTDPSDLRVTIEAEDKHNFKDRLAEIKVPTLVIGGEEDYFYPVRETAAGIPNAELILYEGFGHNAMFDNSRQFQEDILTFLKESTSENI
ncbi:MAG: alpha/beta hydrolase [Crenarchaeota archaeon]|nr:alpha/beta hydrolase [Thermoproteota archaeon]